MGWNFDRSILATAGMDGMVQLWNPSGELLVQLQGPSDAIEWISWHPRGNVIAAGSADNTSWMWNAKGLCLNVFSGHDGALTCGQFSKDGKLLITTAQDETLKVWHPAQGNVLVTVAGDLFHQATVLSFDCSTDSSVVFSGAENGTLRLASLSFSTFAGRRRWNPNRTPKCSSRRRGTPSTPPWNAPPTLVPGARPSASRTRR